MRGEGISPLMVRPAGALAADAGTEWSSACGVRVRRAGRTGRRAAATSTAAEIEHGDAVDEVMHDGEVVADEEVGEAELLAAGPCSRLMTCAWMETSSAETGSSSDDEVGVEGERAGDGDALALAAGEFVRVAVARRRRGRPTWSQQRRRRGRGASAAARAVDAQRLGDDVADGHARVERGERVLEDDLDVAARRAARQRGGVRCGRPSKRTSPAVGAMQAQRRRCRRCDLPQPDSPTRPSVSPCGDGEARRRRRRGRWRGGRTAQADALEAGKRVGEVAGLEAPSWSCGHAACRAARRQA
jgi:hypothetical protein